MQMVAHEGLERLPGWAALQTRLCKSETAAWVLGGRLKDELIDALHAMLQRCELGQLGLMLALLSRCAQVLEGPAPAADGELRPLGKRLPLGLQAEGSRRQRIERLLRWIYENLGSPLAVSDAAGLLAVSPAAFSRTFRRAVGKPFNEYVNDLRIAQASLELLRSERPIAEIAQRCGYPTLSNFQHQFQQRHGIPPRQYRSALIPRSGNP
jgi:AraC-like DNA-binding protein